MEYPTFSLPLLGGSLLIACVAIFHVFIAQFSVGSGFLLAITERKANLSGDRPTLEFLRRYSFLVLLVPYVLGTITGVGIWFVTSVVNPRAISLMIHLFVWGWAAEWVVFLVELTAIYLYFYTWDRISPRAHNAIAWIFAIASAITLVLINAIVSFMLTPGAWRPLAPGQFWPAFFNPSMWPTMIERLLVSLALAGAFAIALAAWSKKMADSTREKICRVGYRMMLPSLLCLPLSAWAFHVIPRRSQVFLEGSGIPMGMFFATGLTCFLLLAVGGLLAMRRREYRPTILGSSLLLLFAFIGYGSFEFVREGIRKPYVVEGFMYSTGVTVPSAAPLDPRANLSRLQQDGILTVTPGEEMLTAAPWQQAAFLQSHPCDPVTRGRMVYDAACAVCHQVDQGYNALRPVVRGWTRDEIRRYLNTMHEQRPMMPPFPGSEADKYDLTAFVDTLTERPSPSGLAQFANAWYCIPESKQRDPTEIFAMVARPWPDMLGLPMQPTLLKLLYNATLALHWIFIAGAVGGAAVVLVNTLAGASPVKAEVNKSILLPLPFTLSMAVTLGIAPLLFVQVLYGNVFYVANVLIAAQWLAIVPLVIVQLYLFYAARKRLREKGKIGWVLPAVMVLIFAALASILSSNAQLMQSSPEQWLSVWGHRGFGSFHEGLFPQRYGFALAGFLALGGLIVAILAKAGLCKDAPAATRAFRIGMGMALIFSVLQVGAALLLHLGILPAMSDALRQSMHPAALTLAITLALAPPLILLSIIKPAWPVLILAALDYVVLAVSAAFARDALRDFSWVENIPVHPQWGPFALFAAFLVVGLVLIVVMVKLAKPAAADDLGKQVGELSDSAGV